MFHSLSEIFALRRGRASTSVADNMMRVFTLTTGCTALRQEDACASTSGEGHSIPTKCIATCNICTFSMPNGNFYNNTGVIDDGTDHT